MKYILILAVKYKKYKRPAKLTLHIGDTFIDTFELDQTYLNSENILAQMEQPWELKISQWGIWKSKQSQVLQNMPKFFKFYELDDAYLNDMLRIKIENSNSDYTNGFLKNSSLIQLSLVGLLPSHLVYNKGEKLMKTCLKFINANEKYRKRNVLADTDDGLFSWPFTDSFCASSEDNQFKENKIKNNFWWIGGSFTAEFPIRKKHKVKYLGSFLSKEKGFVSAGNIENLIMASFKPLLNIYNEDQ